MTDSFTTALLKVTFPKGGVPSSAIKNHFEFKETFSDQRTNVCRKNI